MNKKYIAGKFLQLREIDQDIFNNFDQEKFEKFRKDTAKGQPMILKEIRLIVSKIGWPKISEFGVEVSRAAFFLVQHMDIDPKFQEECLKLMQSLPENEVSKRNIAYLIDRVNKNKGLPQIYGTQIADGGIPYTLKDPDNVDKLRATMDLEPLEEYIEKNKAFATSQTNRPIQYVKGYVEFYKLKFFVDENALIPRPETELLVDEVIKYSKSNPKFTVLDIGTGAGNIAISLAKNISGIKIVATEVSKEALEIAKKNARFHQVEDRIEFIQSDLLEGLDSIAALQNDNLVIVTNLPYIPTDRINYLDSSVKDFEPHVALDGGEDGFELYRQLFQQIQQAGWKPKLILGEIDYTHGETALSEAQKYFPKANVEVKLDLAHKQRILFIQQ